MCKIKTRVYLKILKKSETGFNLFIVYVGVFMEISQGLDTELYFDQPAVCFHSDSDPVEIFSTDGVEKLYI